MGSVWAATHEMLGREVAIKFLLPSLEGSETAAARFVAEAKLAARVKHRFVVDVFDFGITEDGLYYMGQELLEGTSLADSMYDGPAWALPELLHFVIQCLSGLEAVHQTGIIHRDLKPENIFVIRDVEGMFPKLLDFGISKQAEAQGAERSLQRASLRAGRTRRLTGVGTTIGTPAYMSPEQLCNASTMDGRADLYSMGVILYEWLTGRVPIDDTDNPTELYRRICERSAPTLLSLRADLGRELCAAVARALSPDPEQRFANAAEMRAELVRLLPSQPRVFSIVQKQGLQLERPLAVALQTGKSRDLSGRQGQVAPGPTPARGSPRSLLQPAPAVRRAVRDSEPVEIPGLSSSGKRSWLIAALAAVGIALLAALLTSSGRTSHVKAGSVPKNGVASEAQTAVGTGVMPGFPAELAAPARVSTELVRGVEIPQLPSQARGVEREHSKGSGSNGERGTRASTSTRTSRRAARESGTKQAGNSKVVRTLDF